MKKYLKAFILMLAGIFSISLTACNKTTNKTTNKETTKTYTVVTDSMKWNDELAPLSEWENYEIKGFSSGDKIVVSYEYDELKVGDVITYTYINGNDEKLTSSSRIVDILINSSTYIVEDDRIAQQYPYRITYGSSYIYELESSGKIKFVNSNNIIGKVTKVEYKEA